MLGDGTLTNPFQITTRAELESLSNDYTASYKLMNDIDLSGIDWIPFPVQDVNSSYFVGVLDGNNKKIKNMKMNRTVTYSGLFSYLREDSLVKNLGLEDIDITSSNGYVGGLFGSCKDSIVKNCYVTGKINATSSTSSAKNVGSFVGYTVSNAYFYDCYTDVELTIKSPAPNFGGFVGYSYFGSSYGACSFNRCLALGTVNHTTSGASNKGGFYGLADTGTLFDSCFFDSTRANRTAYTTTGVTAYTTTQMQTPANFVGLTDDTWIKEAGAYPTLKSFSILKLKESREVLSYLSTLNTDTTLTKLATYKSVSYVDRLSVQSQRIIKSSRTGTSFVKDIVAGASRSIEVIKVEGRTITSYMIPITSNVEILKQQIKVLNEIVTSYVLPIDTSIETINKKYKYLTETVSSVVSPITSDVETTIEVIRKSLSFVDKIVGKSVVANLSPKQIEIIVQHLENGTLSQYLSSQYTFNVVENLTLSEVRE